MPNERKQQCQSREVFALLLGASQPACQPDVQTTPALDRTSSTALLLSPLGPSLEIVRRSLPLSHLRRSLHSSVPSIKLTLSLLSTFVAVSPLSLLPCLLCRCSLLLLQPRSKLCQVHENLALLVKPRLFCVCFLSEWPRLPLLLLLVFWWKELHEALRCRFLWHREKHLPFFGALCTSSETVAWRLRYDMSWFVV